MSDEVSISLPPLGSLLGHRLLSSPPINAFLGVPYALPPTSERRFAKPSPLLSFSSTPLPCHQWRPNSIQLSHHNCDASPTSEDCLYLNIFAPGWKSEEAFPILFIIHGGAFAMGSPRDLGDEGIARNIVSHGIIVITVQYRLGYLGFFSHPPVFKGGNFALWDLLEALKWTHEHIGAFGGDSSRITVCGQSSGASLAEALSVSPHSRALIHSVIQMSGHLDEAASVDCIANCSKKARELGVQEDWDEHQIFSHLRSQPAAAFAAGWLTIGEESLTRIRLEIAPIIDDDFLPQSCLQTLSDHPRMLGVTRLESANFLLSFKEDDNTLRKILDSSSKAETDALVSEYLSLGCSLDPSNPLRRSVLEAHSARVLSSPLLLLTRRLLSSSAPPPLFLYRFDHTNATMFGELKDTFKCATHCSDLPFLFGVSPFAPLEWTNQDREVERFFSTAIANFVKHGHPTASSSSPPLPYSWPPATHAHPERHLIIDSTPTVSDSYFDGLPARIIGLRRE